MPHFPTKSSRYKRLWVKDLPTKYCEEWDKLGLINPPVKKDGTVVRSVPFYAAQQLHKLEKIPRQLRGATKPVVVTTSKIGEPFYTPQLDFDLRTVRPLPLAYNNLLDPHLKHFFNQPAKRKVLEKRGFITSDGDVICHSMKELNQYREFLYWNHQEMLTILRKDINTYLPKILAKRRAIAEITSEKRRYNLLRRKKVAGKKKNVKVSADQVAPKSAPKSALNSFPKLAPKSAPKLAKKTDSVNYKNNIKSSTTSKVSEESITQEPLWYLDNFYKDESRKFSTEENEAATKIQACFTGYITRKKLAQAYQKNLKIEMKKRFGSVSKRKKIWEKSKSDMISTCHTHSCTENLAKQFIITDLPSMMKFLKDPISQQAYRRNYLLRLMHTPCMDISGTMVKPLLQDEIRHHSSKFRWV